MLATRLLPLTFVLMRIVSKTSIIQHFLYLNQSLDLSLCGCPYRS